MVLRIIMLCLKIYLRRLNILLAVEKFRMEIYQKVISWLPKLWENLIAPLILPAVISICVSYMTVKFSVRQNKEENIAQKRNALYEKVLALLDVHEYGVTFLEEDFWTEFLNFKTSMKLVASKKVVDNFKIVFELLRKAKLEYDDYYIENHPYNNACYPIRVLDEYGEEIEDEQFDVQTYEILTNKCKNKQIELIESYRNSYMESIQDLSDAMRKDLGSDKF